MVVYPNYADGEEADHVCGIRRPAFKQRIRQTSGLDLRDFQLQYEEGCGDGVDPIAEGLGAASAQCTSLLAWLLQCRARSALDATPEQPPRHQPNG